MTMLRSVVCTLVVLITTLAHAESFPTRAVTIIVPLSPGSASDALTRILARALSDTWKVPVVVKNKPGANGIPATSSLVHAEPDGYTLLTNSTNHVINASLYAKLPYDSQADVKAVARIGFTPLILCASPSGQAATLKELIAFAKANPGKLLYGSAGTGSTTHLAGEMLKTIAGVDLTHVPYKGIDQAQTDLASGQIDVMFVVPSVAIPQINAKRYRAIGVGGPERLPQMPNLATLEELGLHGFDATAWIGLLAPAGVPDDIVTRISDEVIRTLSLPAVNEQIVNLGFVVASSRSVEFGKYMQLEQIRWGQMVKASGARAD
jgi:tripartite-type tricarboxylate transporter receptor subunit TctC